MAERNMRIVLAPDSLEAENVLEATTVPTEKCFTWNDFSDSGLEKNATDVKFEVSSDENLYNQIKINIIAVGKYLVDGSCTVNTSKLSSF